MTLDLLDSNQKNLLYLLFKQSNYLIVGHIKLAHLIYFVQSNIFFINKNNQANLDNFSYSFSRWNYGPYTKSIDSDLVYLEKLQLIEISTVFTNKSSYKQYKLSLKGIQLVNDFISIDQAKYQLKVDAYEWWSNKFAKYSPEQVQAFTYKACYVFVYEMGDSMPLCDYNNGDELLKQFLPT